MELFLVMKYMEGNCFSNLKYLDKRLGEMGHMGSSGALFKDHELAKEHATAFSAKNKCRTLVLTIDLEKSILIVPTAGAVEAKLK